MRAIALAAIGTLMLAGCAGTHVRKPSICDGKHRRPANVYGSILPTLPVPVPASQAGASTVVPPGTGPQPLPAPLPPAAPTPVVPVPSTGEPPVPGATAEPAPAPRTSSRTSAPGFPSC